MERPWRARRLRVIVATASTAIMATACANDSNANRSDNVSDVVTGNPGGAETTASANTNVVERFEIEIANFQFGPADAEVAVGTEVVWLNADTDTHSIISTGELFASSDTFVNGETYAVVFTEPGTYEYTCGVHPFMAGTITVA